MDVEDAGRGVVGEDEVVEARALRATGAERRVDDPESVARVWAALLHLAVEVVADPLGRDLADRGAEDEQDHQGQPGGDARPGASAPASCAGAAAAAGAGAGWSGSAPPIP